MAKGSRNTPLTKFWHQNCSVWNGEFFGHDVTIARRHGTQIFEAWLDTDMIGTAKTWNDAQKLTLKFAIQ